MHPTMCVTDLFCTVMTTLQAHTITASAQKPRPVCKTVIKMRKNAVSSSLTPFIDRICLPYCLIGRNRADGMEDANVNVKTIVTCPRSPFRFHFPHSIFRAKECSHSAF
ncbi:hypothetical protein H4582DRAFT_339186 [Lactarius indigo]|nr:hypothetical protein H4582DRAFT_339186 [Lactarius indigo]